MGIVAGSIVGVGRGVGVSLGMGVSVSNASAEVGTMVFVGRDETSVLVSAGVGLFTAAVCVSSAMTVSAAAV